MIITAAFLLYAILVIGLTRRQAIISSLQRRLSPTLLLALIITLLPFFHPERHICRPFGIAFSEGGSLIRMMPQRIRLQSISKPALNSALKRK